MASRKANLVEGLAITDADGKRRKYVNTANGKIEDLPSQQMVFDTQTGKLMVVAPAGNKTISLDNRVFTEMDADGFFVETIRDSQRDGQEYSYLIPAMHSSKIDMSPSFLLRRNCMTEIQMAGRLVLKEVCDPSQC